MSETYIALLRGINVGGKNKLPMKDLVQIVSQVGGRDVKTYIQSGNVVFKADEDAASLSARVSALIKEQAGLSVPVVVRSREALRQVVRRNPFVASGSDPDALHVMFLSDMPSAEAIASLDPMRSPGDSFVVLDREIYLHCPKGLADTKLTNDYFDRRLKTVSTGRNWRTTLKLLELCEA